MRAGLLFRVAGAALVTLGGLAVWIAAALSALPGDRAPLWVTLGAALVMVGMGLGFMMLHPRRASKAR